MRARYGVLASSNRVFGLTFLYCYLTNPHSIFQSNPSPSHCLSQSQSHHHRRPDLSHTPDALHGPGATTTISQLRMPGLLSLAFQLLEQARARVQVHVLEHYLLLLHFHNHRCRGPLVLTPLRRTWL